MRFVLGTLLIFFKVVLMVTVGIFYILGYTDYKDISEIVKDITQGYPSNQEELLNC